MFHSLKYDYKPFSRCKPCLHPMLYPINTLQKSNRTRNDQVKSKVAISVEYKIKRKFTFLRQIQNIFHLVWWKYQHFHSCYALVKNTDFFHRTRRNIFGIHLKNVNILYISNIGSVKQKYWAKIAIIFLSVSLNICFWALKRTISLRPFFWVPTTYALVEK